MEAAPCSGSAKRPLSVSLLGDTARSLPGDRLHETLLSTLRTMPQTPEPASRRALARVELWLSDAVLGVLIFGAVSWMIYADLAGDRSPDALAYGWAFILGALMLVRRKFPLLILSFTIAGLFTYYAAGYPAIGLGVPLAGALLSAAQFRKLRWPVLGAVVTLGIAYGVRLSQGQDFDRIIGFEIVGELGTVVAAIALGVSLRLRRELQHSSSKLLAATAEQERARAVAAASAERAAIARELHDSLGHHATVVSMHADVILEAVNPDAPSAQESARIVKETGHEMLNELRATVRTLRSGAPSGPRQIPTFSVDFLQKAVFEPLPLAVKVDIDVNRELPSPVESAAYRILQEALTNVVKHSHAETTEVNISSSSSTLHLTVADPGPSKAPDGTAVGYGLHGMRERAEALGGSLSARAEGSGFTVEALLPIGMEGKTP